MKYQQSDVAVHVLIEGPVVEEDIRKWITASLFSGCHRSRLQEILIKAGFSPAEVEAELRISAPYIEVVAKLRSMLTAREGLLKTLDYQMRALPHYLKLEKVRLPPFAQFMQEYYYPNRAGLFSGALDNCEAKQWTPRNLVDKVGADTIVEMQSEYGGGYSLNHERYKKKISFGKFIDLIEDANSSNNCYLAAGNYAHNSEALKVLKEEIQVGDGYLGAENPAKNSRLYFLIGPKGTVANIHFDRINNLFIQVYGRKRILLVPALQVPYMYNTRQTFSEVDMANPDFQSYPEFSSATIIETEVGPGDCLFIPIGWWHHVTSLSSSISLACSNINIPDCYENNFIDFTKIF